VILPTSDSKTSFNEWLGNLKEMNQYDPVYPRVEFVDCLKTVGPSLRLAFPFHLISANVNMENSETQLDALHNAFFNYLAIYTLQSKRAHGVQTAGETIKEHAVSKRKLCELLVCFK
jgi:hypothetical protein